MSLKRAVAAGVEAAVNAVRDLMVDVEWTFVSSDAGNYDPINDTFSHTSFTQRINVLAYEDRDDDNQIMFSSRGNFVETPTQIDTVKILMLAKDAGARKPSVRDRYVWDGESFLVSNVERVPGDSIYIMRSHRV